MSDEDFLQIPVLDPLKVYRFGVRARYDPEFRDQISADPIPVLRKEFGLEFPGGVRSKRIAMWTEGQLKLMRSVEQAIARQMVDHPDHPEMWGPMLMGAPGVVPYNSLATVTFVYYTNTHIYTNQNAATGIAAATQVILILAVFVAVAIIGVTPPPEHSHE